MDKANRELLYTKSQNIRTRSNPLKLVKTGLKLKRKYSFMQQVVKLWNLLPKEVEEVDSIDRLIKGLYTLIALSGMYHLVSLNQ